MGNHVTESNGAYCPIPSTRLLNHRLATGKYIRTEDGLEKQCSCCGEYWPADTEFFYAVSTDPGGLHTWCKACYRDNRAKREAAA